MFCCSGVHSAGATWIPHLVHVACQWRKQITIFLVHKCFFLSRKQLCMMYTPSAIPLLTPLWRNKSYDAVVIEHKNILLTKHVTEQKSEPQDGRWPAAGPFYTPPWRHVAHAYSWGSLHTWLRWPLPSLIPFIDSLIYHHTLTLQYSFTLHPSFLQKFFYVPVKLHNPLSPLTLCNNYPHF